MVEQGGSISVILTQLPDGGVAWLTLNARRRLTGEDNYLLASRRTPKKCALGFHYS